MESKTESSICSKINPSHYLESEIFTLEPIEVMKSAMTPEAYRGFLVGNVIKYVYRYRGKNGVEDLEKAKAYIDFLKADLLGKDPLFFLYNKDTE